jgi:signal transduction histidine kinase
MVMTLANRFSVFVLGTLGLTLVGFSGALFASSAVYLRREIDERLRASLTLLGTCVEARSGWVRWEPREKRLPPNRWSDRHATTWMVYDGSGRLLTAPKKLPLEQLATDWAPPREDGRVPGRVTDRLGRSWRVAQRLVRPTGTEEPGSPRPADTPDGKSYHREVLLVAFVSVQETEAALASLGWFLVSISLLIWVTAAVCARWLSQKTLVPLMRLVDSARSLAASNPGWSLPELGTCDELDVIRGAFNDLLARLHQAYERQRRFSGDASHQLRTPVAIMTGHLEVALRSERSPEENLRVLHLAHRHAVALGRIVESLLFLSRGDSSLLTRTGPLELGAWLTQHLASRTDCARSCDIHLDVRRMTPLWINAQPDLLSQLLENLLDNACKYSRVGTPIRVALARDASSAVLVVEDSGCGIAQEDLPKIFEPFFRSASSSEQRIAGIGLGLSVVERIVNAFGGAVTVRSQIGSGSRFEVRLNLFRTPYSQSAAFTTDMGRLSNGLPAL